MPSGRRLIFLVFTAHHDLQRIVRQRSLQCLCLIPRRAHPDLAFLVGRQDHRHRLGMDRLDDRVRRGRQKAVDEVRAGDRLRLRAPVSFDSVQIPAKAVSGLSSLSANQTCGNKRRLDRVRGQRYPLTMTGTKTAWQRLRTKAGVQGFRFHDYRHDFGTKLLRSSGNLKLVQKAMNHADIKSTIRYAHVLDEDVAAAVERVAKSREKPRGNVRRAI
jgi:Phage integrase family